MDKQSFEAAWGLVQESGTFPVDQVASVKSVPVHELALMESSASQANAKLAVMSDEVAGMAIMHLFVKDVLGRDSALARIFDNKTKSDLLP